MEWKWYLSWGKASTREWRANSHAHSHLLWSLVVLSHLLAARPPSFHHRLHLSQKMEQHGGRPGVAPNVDVPKHFGPPKGAGDGVGTQGEGGGGGGSRAEVPGSQTYQPQNDPLVGLIILSTDMWEFRKKKITPWAVRSQQPRLEGWMGEIKD